MMSSSNRELGTKTSAGSATQPAEQVQAPAQAQQATSKPVPKPMPAKDVKQNARTHISYDVLAWNTESYVGQIVYYRGQVVQVSEQGGLQVILRVAVSYLSLPLSRFPAGQRAVQIVVIQC